jgi:murein DD-endopeptidase MepM/ murein hydrolase activator NlpD
MAIKGKKTTRQAPQPLRNSNRRRAPGRRQPRSPHRGSLRLGLLLAALVGFNIYYFLYRDGTSIPDVMERAAMAGTLSAEPVIDLDDDLGAAGPGDGAALEEGAESGDLGYSVSGKVGSGDSMTTILERHGLDSLEAHKVITAMTGHLEFKHIHAGQSYRLRFDSAGSLDELEYRVSRVEGVVVNRTDEGLVATRKREETEIREVEIGGKITSSLYQSIKDAGEDTQLVAFFVDVFAYDLNFYVDTHPGDSFRIVVEKEYLDGDLLRYGRIIAAEYRGLAGTYRAFRYEVPGEPAEYYNEKGESVAKTFLKTPLKFTRISSKFNPRRMHPVLHRRKGHWGVDYAAPTGTPIWAAASGKIIYRGRRGGAGNCVILRHDNGYTTLYMHLSKFRSGQRVGSRVRQKDVIGYVGATGLATGPHLHFGLKRSGRYVDPLKVKMSRIQLIPKKYREDFNRIAEGLLERLDGINVL